MEKEDLILLGIGIVVLTTATVVLHIHYKNKNRKVAQTVISEEEEPEKQGLTIARPPLENLSFEEKMENMTGKPQKRLLINRLSAPYIS